MSSEKPHRRLSLTLPTALPAPGAVAARAAAAPGAAPASPPEHARGGTDPIPQPSAGSAGPREPPVPPIERSVPAAPFAVVLGETVEIRAGERLVARLAPGERGWEVRLCQDGGPPLVIQVPRASSTPPAAETDTARAGEGGDHVPGPEPSRYGARIRVRETPGGETRGAWSGRGLRDGPPATGRATASRTISP